MRRLVFLLAAVTALVLASGLALAEPRDDASGAAPSEGAGAAQPSLEVAVEPHGAAGEMSVASGERPRWLMGTFSNTYYYNFFLDIIQSLTAEQVGYFGTLDASYPRVGDTYYGAIVVADIHPSVGTPVVPEVKLPPNTRFDIHPGDPDKRVRCYYENFETGQVTEITGSDCPQSPKVGTSGAGFAQFVPPQGWWPLPPGKDLQIIFPLTSTAPLKGSTFSSDCLQGAVWASESLDLWDRPLAGERCPLPRDHGVWQGVTVSPNSAPTIGSMRPVPGSKTRDTTPLVSAVVRDRETDLAKSNVRLYVDGQARTFSYSAATDKLTYSSRKLSYRKHQVKVVATDAQGRTTTKSWSFSVVQ